MLPLKKCPSASRGAISWKWDSLDVMLPLKKCPSASRGAISWNALIPLLGGFDRISQSVLIECDRIARAFPRGEGEVPAIWPCSAYRADSRSSPVRAVRPIAPGVELEIFGSVSWQADRHLPGISIHQTHSGLPPTVH